MDKTIKRYIQKNLSRIPEIKKSLDSLKEQQSLKLTEVQRTGINLKIDELQTLIDKFEKASIEYEEKSKPYLKTYEQICRSMGKKLGKTFDQSSVGKKLESYIGSKFGETLGEGLGEYLGHYFQEEVEQLDIKRQRTIESFLEMCNEYYPHNIRHEAKRVPSDCCPICEMKLVEMESEMVQCPNCYRQYEKIIEVVATKKSKDPLSDHLHHFEKIYDAVIGKNIIDIPQDLIETLETLAQNRGYLKNNVWKEGLTRADYVKLVYQSKNSKFYGHANYIIFKWLNYPLPEYRATRQEIFDRFILFAQGYDSFEKKLSYFPNSLYLLFKILESLGEEIELEELKAPTSDTNLDQYDKIWKQACERYNWTYISSRY